MDGLVNAKQILTQDNFDESKIKPLSYQVIDWFTFVKWSYDTYRASYIFLTYKPMNLIIDTYICTDIQDRSVQVDVDARKDLCLRLSQDRAIAFVEQQQFIDETKKATIVEQLKNVDKKIFASSVYGKILTLKKML